MPETRVVTKLMREHPEDSFSIERYLSNGGYEGLKKALGQTPDEIVELVKASGLRGRGGAGFATGQKWSLMPPDIKPRYVVVNDDEGEPCTFKDRELTERDPHAIIEGALICAHAVRADAVYIYVRGEFAKGARRLERAIGEARDRGFIKEVPVYIHPGAGAYICGEETALLDSLEGYRGQPRLKPPFFPAVKGLYSVPTALNNVETLATLPHIVSKGVDWFRSMGTEQSPGSRVFSISGRVERPGNYEFALGTPFAELLEIAGGISEGKAFKAHMTGASAPIVATQDITMDFESYGAAGSMLGSGSVVVFDETSCMVRMAHIFTRFFNNESCGKCTPCREGTWWTVKVLERIESGEGREDDLAILREVCDNMSAPTLPYSPKGQCFCPLGDGAAWALRSAINLFEDEFRAHVETGICPMRLERVPA
jgi:NADH-quinone oxidoreductase subunit F